MDRIEKKEIDALISLLDDMDIEVYNHVTDQLLSLGPAVIPNLENAWENTLEPTLQERIEELIHRIQFDLLKEQFQRWSRDPNGQLLEAMLIINRYAYPELDEEGIYQTITRLKRDVWIELNNYLTPLEKVNVMNQVLFKYHLFKSQTKRNADSRYQFLNILLESKKGSPYSMGLFYLLLAQMLDLPIYGVGLPHHFVLAYLNRPILDFENGPLVPKTLFYINPFNGGVVFTKNEIQQYLEKIYANEKATFYQPLSNKEVIRLYLVSLSQTYTHSGEEDKAADMDELIRILKE